tara:strand:- start:271 stop:396 length:126 start_codon:yes stop_codon:yes gene_type:complete
LGAKVEKSYKKMSKVLDNSYLEDVEDDELHTYTETIVELNQ